MTKERLIELRKNCVLYRPNMEMLRELFSFLIEEEIKVESDPYEGAQRVILKYTDECIDKFKEAL